ncbi:hypothetical protein C0033_16680 [Clostridium sp. chh4-2]|uniref:hypothetical protein n=1 Tax=Clostridium sp. chh4-2 TaxID=2067550 RepID=UPI000CCDF4C3|nr:hypothetical protein [Clostridium sp. chh4-2]PNV60828.1 hypothetical protein C0033_16680 [Clostridium sp. chh4-2]
MKNYSIKKLLCLIVVLSMFTAMPALAAEETTLLPEGQSVSLNIEGIEPRGLLIATRVASIANNEDGTLDVYGQIIAHTTLDYASITLYLERYDFDVDDWVFVSSKDAEFTLEEMGEAFMGVPTASYTLSGGIEPGNYYRIRGIYIAKKDGRRESANAETDGVLLTKIK